MAWPRMQAGWQRQVPPDSAGFFTIDTARPLGKFRSCRSLKRSAVPVFRQRRRNRPGRCANRRRCCRRRCAAERKLSEGLGAAGNGVNGHCLGDSEPSDAVVLDLGRLQMAGNTVLRKWRASGRTMLVLIRTARDGWYEKGQIIACPHFLSTGAFRI